MATIAVIDDEAAIRDVLGEILQTAGHRALTFPDGAPFLESPDIHQVDMVITDYVMPTSGEEVVRVLGEKGFPMPVVIMAGHMPNQTACMLLAMGAHDVMEKPILITDLLRMVDKWVGVAYNID